MTHLTKLTYAPAKVGLSFELPFGNHAALGRYEQARSLELQSSIQAGNVERTVRNSIHTLTVSALHAAKEVSIHQRSVEYYLQLLASQVERFRLGESSVVDAVLTEQQKISEELALVGSWQTLAQLMSRLRYETGTLVRYRVDADEVVVERVEPTGFDFGS